MHVQPDGESVQVLVSMPESGQGSQDVSLTIDGETTEATVEAAGDSTDIRRTTVLVIDTSISMADGRLEAAQAAANTRSEEHTSELQSLMRTSSAVFCLKKQTQQNQPN